MIRKNLFFFFSLKKKCLKFYFLFHHFSPLTFLFRTTSAGRLFDSVSVEMLRRRRTLPLRSHLEGSHAQSKLVRNFFSFEENEK
jgi:hypothetical protein